MAGDDATDEGKVQVVGKSRELRALSTELYEELRVRKLRAEQREVDVPGCALEPLGGFTA
jgi:hypothetical protein